MEQKVFFNIKSKIINQNTHVLISEIPSDFDSNEEIILNLYTVIETGNITNYCYFCINDGTQQNPIYKKICIEYIYIKSGGTPKKKNLEFTGILIPSKLKGKQIYFYSTDPITISVTGIGYKG